jgi:hypothetical protein
VRDKPKLAVERQRQMFVIEVAEPPHKPWIQMELWLVYEKDGVSRRGVAKAEVTV